MVLAARRVLLVAGCALLAAGCALLAPPRPLPTGSESAARLCAGPFRVRAANVALHDAARDRRLPATIWWPVDHAAPAPLAVQAHGFLADRGGLRYLARHLASRGWVVIAATHPHTARGTPGGARVEDVVRQPGDVRFLIDRLLAADGLRAADTDLPGLPPIDPTRIAVMGHSLGGLTAVLAAFHPRLRDPRIAAAISIAGPAAMFGPRFFRAGSVPLLLVAGTSDVVVDPRRNARAIVAHVPAGTLATIAGGSHTGFNDTAARLPRFAGNPDRLACWILARTLRLDAAVAKYRALARESDVDLDAGVRPCAEDPPRLVMHPARQQALTTLAVTAFLESRFAPDPARRACARRYLAHTLPREVPEVEIAPGPDVLPAAAALPPRIRDPEGNPLRAGATKTDRRGSRAYNGRRAPAPTASRDP